MDIQLSLEDEIKTIDAKIEDAKENLGDVEVRDAIVEKAEIYTRHGHVDEVSSNSEIQIGNRDVRRGSVKVGRY